MNKREIAFITSNEFTGEELICRREYLAELFLKGEGIEIGALHKPLTVNKSKCKVKYVDYKTLEENRKRYPELINELIVFTDYVDDGFILRKIEDSSQDFIISNHALEHSPDPIGTLLTWYKKLKPNGVIYVGIPIAEKCYDKGRKTTTLEHLKDDRKMFLEKSKEEILEVCKNHLVDFINISDKNIRILNKMNPCTEEEVERLYSVIMDGLTPAINSSNTYEDLLTSCITYLNKVYDIHYHTFTPTSYELLLRYFCQLSNSRLEGVYKNGSGECIGIIRKV